MISIYLSDCIEHIFRARIHRLPALDQMIYPKVLKDLTDTFTGRYRDKADLFLRHLRFCCFCRYCFGRYCILFLDMLAVDDLHIDQFTVFQSFLQYHTRIIGIYAHINDALVYGDRYLISDQFQIFSHFMLALHIELLVQLQGKCGMIKMFEFFLFRLFGRKMTDLAGFLGSLFIHSKFNALTQKSVISAFQKRYKAGTTGINDTGFFQNRQHLRCLIQHFLCVLDHLL